MIYIQNNSNKISSKILLKMTIFWYYIRDIIDNKYNVPYYIVHMVNNIVNQ